MHHSAVLSYSIVSDSLQPHGPTRSMQAHQAPLFMGILQARILRQVAMPSSKDLPDPRTEPGSPALQVDSVLLSHLGSPTYY